MDSLLDLANKDIGTSIHTNVVTADGYEIENLIEKSAKNEFEASTKFGPGGGSSSSNNRNYLNGFMAEYFVKPPIDIVVQFPCLVDIDCLILNRKSGSKRVSEFTVFTAHSKPAVCNINLEEETASPSSAEHKGKCTPTKGKSRSKFPVEEAEIPSAYPFKYELNYSDTNVRKENLADQHMVAKLNSRTATNDLVIFRNARNSNGKGNEFEKSVHQTVNFFSLQFLYGVSHLIIRIFRTEGSTVAAVKSLQIWGRPSRNNGRLVNNHVYGLVKQMKKQQDLERANDGFQNLTSSSPEKQLNEHDKPETSIKNACDEASSLDHITSRIIPDEFIDPITFELMVLPVLLPSGHTIDSSTLEKCTQADENNGRQPLDPFTGKMLTEVSKAIPNTALKFRLDEFLLKNNVTLGGDVMRQTSGVNLKNGFSTIERMKNVKRKLDSKTENFSAKRHFRISHIVNGTKEEEISKEAYINVKDRKSRVDGGAKKDFFPDSSSKEPVSQDMMLGSKLQIVKNKTKRTPHFINHTRKISVNDVAKCPGSTHELVKQNIDTDTSSSKFSHEQSLKDSLETALQKMTNSFTKPCAKSQQEDSTSTLSCSICKVSKNDTSFFKLPCNHLICRICLTSNSAQSKCKLCWKYFSNSEIMRVHLSSYFNHA